MLEEAIRKTFMVVYLGAGSRLLCSSIVPGTYALPTVLTVGAISKDVAWREEGVVDGRLGG